MINHINDVKGARNSSKLLHQSFQANQSIHTKSNVVYVLCPHNCDRLVLVIYDGHLINTNSR